MPSPISRRPAGLLDLLLSQQQGKNPSDLLETVQPVLEMRPFYAAERLSVAVANNNATAVGVQTNSVNIPSGEYWFVYGVGMFVQFASITSIVQVSCQVNTLPVTAYSLHNFGLLDPVVQTVEAAQVGMLFPQPISFPSGTEFKTRVTRMSLGGQPNIPLTMSVLYARMES